MGWGALASFAGGLVSSGASAWSAHEVNKANLEFQKDFAKHGVSWKVQDMKDAGLNPLLANGINATTPAGGSSAMPDFSGISSSAKDIGRMIAEKTAEKAEVDLANAEKTGDLLDAQTGKTVEDSRLVAAERDKVLKETSQIPSLSQAEVDNEFKGKNAPWYEYHARRIYGIMAGIADIQDPEPVARRLAEQAVRGEQNNGNSSRSVLSPDQEKAAIDKLTKEILLKARKERGDKWVEDTRFGEGVKHPTGRSVLY